MLNKAIASLGGTEKEPTVKDVFGLKEKKGDVGIEIEVEGANLPGRPAKYWNRVEDGSLRGESAEYVLRSPVKIKEVPKVLNILSNLFRDAGSKINESPRTSVHVHLNMQNYTFPQVINIFVIYSILEELLVKFCGELREGNLFCLRTKDADYLVDYIRDRAINGDWELLHRASDNIRYAACNFSALSKYGSLEFRSMRGTVDMSLIRAWVSILTKIKTSAIRYDGPSNIVQNMSMLGCNRFLQNTLGDYSELIRCSGMEKMLYDGVRRVQPLAYCTIASLAKKKPMIKEEEGFNWIPNPFDEPPELPPEVFDGDPYRPPVPRRLNPIRRPVFENGMINYVVPIRQGEQGEEVHRNIDEVFEALVRVHRREQPE